MYINRGEAVQMDSGETILRKEVEKYPVLEDKQQLEQLDKYKNSER